MNPEPLPPNYSWNRASNGQPYFSNLTNGTTSWLDPRIEVRTPLPQGWQAQKSQNGALYFENHYARTTQWCDPRHVPFIARAPPGYTPPISNNPYPYPTTSFVASTNRTSVISVDKANISVHNLFTNSSTIVQSLDKDNECYNQKETRRILKDKLAKMKTDVDQLSIVLGLNKNVMKDPEFVTSLIQCITSLKEMIIKVRSTRRLIWGSWVGSRGVQRMCLYIHQKIADSNVATSIGLDISLNTNMTGEGGSTTQLNPTFFVEEDNFFKNEGNLVQNKADSKRNSGTVDPTAPPPYSPSSNEPKIFITNNVLT